MLSELFLFKVLYKDLVRVSADVTVLFSCSFILWNPKEATDVSVKEFCNL